MKVGGIYSFNCGQEAIKASNSEELAEIFDVIEAVNVADFKKTIAQQTSLTGDPFSYWTAFKKPFEQEFGDRGWQTNVQIQCDYPTDFYTPDYSPSANPQAAFREIDFVKNRLGIGVQGVKYSSMVYNVCAKMTIFHNEGFIDTGVEIVPLKELASEMSSGVSYFEQFVWDLEHRGVSDIDIPVLILGLAVG